MSWASTVKTKSIWDVNSAIDEWVKIIIPMCALLKQKLENFCELGLNESSKCLHNTQNSLRPTPTILLDVC